MVAPAATGAAQVSGQQMYANFRAKSRQQRFLMPPQTVIQFGIPLNFIMPQSGWLAGIDLHFAGTIVTGAGTPAANWNTYPPLPYALIKLVRLYTTEGIEISRISGFGLYLLSMRSKRLYQPNLDLSTLLNSTGRALALTTNTGALAQSTTYTFNWQLHLPVVTDDSMMIGMLLCQSNDVRVNLEITFANAADIVSAVPGVTFVPSFTVSPTAEYFGFVNDSAAQPPNLYVHSIYEENFGFNNLGDIVYRPAPGNIFLSLSGILENNAAQIAATAINTIKLQYAQAISPYYEIYATMLMKFKRDFGFIPPDGYFTYTFDMGSGLPGMLDPRDWLDTSQQTDLQFVPNVTGISLTNANMRVVREQLSRIG